MGGLVGQINNVAGALGIAAEKAARLVGGIRALAVFQAQGGSGRGGDPRKFESDPYYRDKYFPKPTNQYKPPRKSRGGGGGGGTVQEDRIGALARSLATEKELLAVWYEDSLVQLSEFNAKELELLGGHAEAKERLEQEHQDRLAAIEQTAKQQRLSETAGLFGALASIASTGGKKMAKAAATFQAIEGTVNAYGAAIKALNTPGITLAGRFAAYASVLAAGLRGVAAIRQAGGVGGGGTGGGYGSPNATSGTTNTGGGAGGGGGNNSQGGSGGSGIVILKYPDTFTISVGAGLTSSTSTSGGYSVTQFTAGTDDVSFSTT